MNSRLILVASLALALAGPAFAQDSYSNPSPAQRTDQQPPVDPEAAPTDEQMTPTETATTDTATTTTTTDTAMADNQTAVPTPRVDLSGTAAVIAPSVPPIISPNAPPKVAANHYDPRKDLQPKIYPTVDRGHVEGDPPIIDHSKDIAPVMEPTTSSVSVVPPGS